MEKFELVSKITDVQTIAKGRGIKVLPFLVKQYGGKATSWRKKKGKAIIRQFGMIFEAELHWFEAHGIGKVNMKIKHKRKV
jgi:hypothetical protein